MKLFYYLCNMFLQVTSKNYYTWYHNPTCSLQRWHFTTAKIAFARVIRHLEASNNAAEDLKQPS